MTMVEKSVKNDIGCPAQRTQRLDFGARYDGIMISVEDDFGFSNILLGFLLVHTLDTPHKLRRTHRRAVVAVVVAVAVAAVVVSVVAAVAVGPPPSPPPRPPPLPPPPRPPPPPPPPPPPHDCVYV